MENSRPVDWAKLKDPTEHIHLFDPSKENILTLATHLMDDKWYLQDHLRKWPIIHAMIQLYLTGPTLNILYTYGNMDGVGGFTNIIPGHKCDIMFKFWNKAAFGATACREFIEVLDLIMDTFKLYRMDSDSPDDRVVKMAKLLGFEQEGSRKYGFRWDGKVYTNFLLGRKLHGRRRS